MDNVREKLIELFVESLRYCGNFCGETGDCKKCQYDKYGNDCGYAIRADHLIANGVTIQKWIPVSERLPENDVMVIGFTPCDGFMFVGYYHEEPKYDWKVWRIVTAMRSTKVMTKKVTHWLPLPSTEGLK